MPDCSPDSPNRWYQSIGFTLVDDYEDSGNLVFARLAFGNGEFTLSPGGNPGPRDVSLWVFTDRVEPLYKALKQRQLHAAGSATNADAGDLEVRFEEDLYTPFYGGRQFGIRDINGDEAVSIQASDEMNSPWDRTRRPGASAPVRTA